MPTIEEQIEALVEAHDRAMAKLHLGASPYDDDPDDFSPASLLDINDRDE